MKRLFSKKPNKNDSNGEARISASSSELAESLSFTSSESAATIHSQKDASDETSTISRGAILFLFALAVVASLLAGFLPFTRYVVYPFSMLATWAHEMGHGVTAIITGGDFVKLELFANLGGVATHRSSGRFASSLVSLGGLLGPAVFGAIMVVVSSKPKFAPYVVAVLSAAIVFSLAIWVRNPFGLLIMTAIAIGLLAVVRFGSATVRVGLAQLISVQLIMSTWTNRNYLFIKEFAREGEVLTSDTGKLQENLWLPYWVWGIAVGAGSIAILLAAFWFAWIRPLQKQQEASAQLA